MYMLISKYSRNKPAFVARLVDSAVHDITRRATLV